MRESESPHPKAGYVYAFLCSITSALMITLINWVERDLPALTVLFLSQLFAALFLSTIFISREKQKHFKQIRIGDWVRLFGLSILYLFGYWTLFAALELLDPTVASFLGRTEVLVTILFAIIFLGERFTVQEIFGALLVFAGVAIIRYVGGIEISRGFLLCLVSAFIWGIAEGLAKVLVRSVEPLLFTWGRSMALFPCFFVLALLSEDGFVLPKTWMLWTGVVALTVAGPVIGRVLYMKSLSLIPVAKAALINQLQPIWVAVLALILIHSSPSIKEWIGGAVILAGCILLVRGKKKATANSINTDL